MKSLRPGIALGFAVVFALTTRAVRAQGDQSDIISAHGDALARSTSAAALAAPKPAVPPNSAQPVIPTTAAVVPLATGAAAATPSVARAPVAPAPVAGASPQSAPITPAPQAMPMITDSIKGPRLGRAALIVIGALIALAMFLWERRRKD